MFDSLEIKSTEKLLKNREIFSKGYQSEDEEDWKPFKFGI
jgi:hypothetical protein